MKTRTKIELCGWLMNASVILPLASFMIFGAPWWLAPPAPDGLPVVEASAFNLDGRYDVPDIGAVAPLYTPRVRLATSIPRPKRKPCVSRNGEWVGGCRAEFSRVWRSVLESRS